MVEVRGGLSAVWLAVLLQVLLGVLQVIGASWITAANGTLLEMALQDITSAEGVLAQVALVGALAGVCITSEFARRAGDSVLTSQKMALQMLEVQIRFVTMRALVFAIGILCCLGGRLSSGRGWPPRVSGQDAATALLADDVDRLRLLVREDRRVRVERGVVHSHTACRAAQLVCVVLSSRGGQQRRLRIRRRHGHVRGRRRLDRPQWRVLQRGHRATAVWRRRYRRVRLLRRLGIAVVAAVQRRE